MRKIKQTFKLIFYSLLVCSAIFAIGIFIPATKFPSVGYKGNFAIQNVTIVDTQTGRLIPRQHLMVRDGRITKISIRKIRPDGLTLLIDGDGKYLIPGLWDMYTQSLKRSPHFHHPLFIANGVTHVRDLSGCMTTDDPYWACTDDRERWTAQALEGNAIAPLYHQNSIYPVNGGAEVPTNFPDYLRADTYEKSGVLVKFGLSVDANSIVVHPEIGKRPYFGLALEAARNDLALVGNKPRKVSLYEALTTYQRSIDEPWLFATECSSNAKNYRESHNAGSIFTALTRRNLSLDQDPDVCGQLISAMAKSDTWWTPSLSALKASAFASDKSFYKNEENKYIPRLMRFTRWGKVRRGYKAQGKAKNMNTAHKDFYEMIKNQVGEAHAAGVQILAGTHSSHPYVYSGFSLHGELEDLVGAGLSNIEALRAATIEAARFSNQSRDYGSVTLGKRADLILLNANPLEDISNTQDIHGVLAGQVYYDREALDDLLEFSRKQAKSWHMNTKLLWDLLRSPIIQHKIKQDYQSAYQAMVKNLRSKVETKYEPQEE